MSKLWSTAVAGVLFAWPIASCSDDTPSGGIDAGTGSSANGGAAGGASGGAGAGGSPGSGGRPGSGGLDCSAVGCAMPPMCSEGCKAPCGCCPCADGEVISLPGGDAKVCKGGCYELASSADAGGDAS